MNSLLLKRVPFAVSSASLVAGVAWWINDFVFKSAVVQFMLTLMVTRTVLSIAEKTHSWTNQMWVGALCGAGTIWLLNFVWHTIWESPEPIGTARIMAFISFYALYMHLHIKKK